jgi:hypothetical protein
VKKESEMEGKRRKIVHIPVVGGRWNLIGLRE